MFRWFPFHYRKTVDVSVTINVALRLLRFISSQDTHSTLLHFFFALIIALSGG